MQQHPHFTHLKSADPQVRILPPAANWPGSEKAVNQFCDQTAKPMHAYFIIDIPN